MAEILPPPDSSASGVPPVTATLAVYALYAIAGIVSLVSAGMSIAPLFGLIGIVGLVIAYAKQEEARGTWVASHLRWLMRTFWWGLGWAVLGWLVLITLGLILIGIPIAYAIWFAASVWILYRVIRGYLLFKDSKPIPGM
jgi:uncharacterized membrane protein